MNRIPIAGPSITQREIDYVTDAVRTAWYENANTYNTRFEQAFAERLGRRFALALPSCTSGLHLALAGLGIGPGDEVIVPDLTWIASAAPVTYVGATPVFADVDRDSWCLDAASLASCITARTKAAIVVDLYGNMPDWSALTAVARQHGIALIEDAAQAIGSRYRDKAAGAFGIAGAFSFHGSKTLTTGEGGMLVTDDERLHRRCLILRDHGRVPGDVMYFNQEIGFKYRMSAMQAALGLAQLRQGLCQCRARRAVAGDRCAWRKRSLRRIKGCRRDRHGQHGADLFRAGTGCNGSRRQCHRRRRLCGEPPRARCGARGCQRAT